MNLSGYLKNNSILTCGIIILFMTFKFYEEISIGLVNIIIIEICICIICLFYITIATVETEDNSLLKNIILTQEQN